MRKSKEIANELCAVYTDAVMQKNWQLFTKKLSEVFMEVAVKDVQELCQRRSVTKWSCAYLLLAPVLFQLVTI